MPIDPNFKNSALSPKVDQPHETAVLSTVASQAGPTQANTLNGQNPRNITRTCTPETPQLPTELGYTATTTERAADSQAWASALQRSQPTAKALRALPEIIQLKNAAATAFLNKDITELQQLTNLRYQQCKHLTIALEEILTSWVQAYILGLVGIPFGPNRSERTNNAQPTNQPDSCYCSNPLRTTCLQLASAT